MIENGKESLDKEDHYGALLTRLSKAFACITHDLFIAKLQSSKHMASTITLQTLFVIIC